MDPEKKNKNKKSSEWKEISVLSLKYQKSSASKLNFLLVQNLNQNRQNRQHIKYSFTSNENRGKSENFFKTPCKL